MLWGSVGGVCRSGVSDWSITPGGNYGGKHSLDEARRTFEEKNIRKFLP